MIAVQIQIDEKTIREAQHILRGIPKAWPKVARRSLLRTVTSSRAILARAIKSRVTGKAKIGDIKQYLYIRYPSMANLRTSLEVSRYTAPLIELAAQQTAEGVTYQPPFGGGRQLLPHAFIATGAARGRQVWLRARYYIGRAKMIEWKGRTMEAIYPQRAFSLARYIKAEDYKELADKGAAMLSQQISEQIGVELRRWRNR